MNFWRVEQKIWSGQTAYIVGGGPSLLSQNLELLRGQNIIVINSSYLRFLDAAFCVFSDTRWFLEHRVPQPGRELSLKDFKGKIVSCSTAATGPPMLWRMHRKNLPGLAEDPSYLMVRNTTLTAAQNLAVHLGVVKMVLLGIDQKVGEDGRSHHHAPHKWRPTPDCYKRQQVDLPSIAEGLRKLGIECVNASPGSALTIWPLVNLEDHVAPVNDIGADTIARVA